MQKLVVGGHSKKVIFDLPYHIKNERINNKNSMPPLRSILNLTLWVTQGML